MDEPSRLHSLRPIVEALEAKLLYAADFAPAAFMAADLHAGQAATDTTAAVNQHEWVFIDAKVPDLEMLLQDFEQQVQQGRNLHVVVIQQDEDGIARISQTLADQDHVSAVHIISHGHDSQVQLGASLLNQATLTERAADVALWGTALTDDGDLLIYGCEVASSSAGQRLLQGLSALTGADVAASDDLTGSSLQGGDWMLEHQTGQIDAAVALSASAQAQWVGTLVSVSPSSQGMAVWTDGGSGRPNFAAWDGINKGTTATTSLTNAQNGDWQILTSAQSPDRTGAIVVGIDAGGSIRGERWDGTQWTSISASALSTNANPGWHGFAVAYEQDSGTGMVVWNNGTGLSYMTFNPVTGTWSGVATISAYTGAEPQRMQIASNPKGDGMVLVVTDANASDQALVWDGDTWGNPLTLDSGTNGEYYQKLGAAISYESLSGQALVFYVKNNEGTLFYRILGSDGAWDNTEYNTPFNTPGQPYAIVTASDPGSDKIAVGAISLTVIITLAPVSYEVEYSHTTALWSGSGWQAVRQGSIYTNDDDDIVGVNMAFAFESKSGDLLAVYGGGSSGNPAIQNVVSHATLAKDSTTWTAMQSFNPGLGSQTGTLKLYADPETNHIMLGVQGTNGKLAYADWDGSAFDSVLPYSTDTGSSATPAFTWFWRNAPATSSEQKLILGNATTSGGWSGVVTAPNSDALALGGPDFSLGENDTAGSFSHLWNASSFGATDLDDIVLVSQRVDLTQGLSLQRGDILFTLGSNSRTLTSSNTVTVNNNDVVLFRPQTEDDYSQGTFTVIIQGMGAGHPDLGGSPNIKGLALVEQDVTVGDMTLLAGDFLFTANSGSAGKDIYVFSPNRADLVGGLLTSNSITRVVRGDQIALSKGITALEVLSRTTWTGGRLVSSGGLLMTLEQAASFGDNNKAVDVNDVALLTLSHTTAINGTAQGNVQVLMDGSNLGLPSAPLDTLALQQRPSPEITHLGGGNTVSLSSVEKQTAVTTMTATTPEGAGPVIYGIAGGADASLFRINASTGELSWNVAPNREAPNDADTNGVYVVTVSASTWNAFEFMTDAQTIQVTVTNVNDVPTQDSNNTLTLDEGSTATIGASSLSAEDEDHTPGQLTYTVTLPTSHGRLELSTTPGVSITSFTQQHIDNLQLRYVHDGSETTADSFKFTVSDGSGGNLSEAAYNISITPVNDAPTLVANAGLTLNEGGTASLTTALLGANDADHTATQLSYTVVTAPAHGQLALSTAPGTAISSFTQAQIDDGLVVYVHSGDEASADSFQFTVSDAAGSTLPQATFNITVQAQNDAPIQATLGSLSTTEGSTSTLGADLLTLSDVDNTPAQLTYTVLNTTAHGQLELSSAPGTAVSSFTQAQINDGLLRYVHDGSETTTDSFSFTVSDGAGGALTEATFSIAITPVNDAPTLVVNAGLTLNEGGTATISTALLGTSDADHTATQLSYTVVTAPAHGQLALSSAPGTAISSFTQAQIDDGLVIYVHSGDEALADSFQFTVSDTAGTTLPQATFNITVQAQNDAPIQATLGSLSTTEGSTSTLGADLLSLSDVDNTPAQLTYTVLNATAHGQLELSSAPGTAVSSFTQAQINDGLLRYVHDGSETTTDSFSFTVSDGAGGALTEATFSIAITPVNDAPTLVVNAGLTLDEGGTTIISTALLGTSDADHTATQLRYTVVTVPAHGQLALSSAPGTAISSFTQAQIDDGLVVYVHSGDEALADSFQFTISDAAGSTLPQATFNITVQAQNDAPIQTTLGSLSTTEGGTATLGADLLNLSDVDNTPVQLTYTIVNATAHGQLELSSAPGTAVSSFTQAQINDGLLRYVHDGSETTTDSFSFTVSDGSGGTLTEATFSIAITPLNDAPTPVANAGLTLDEGGTAIISTALLGTSDADHTATQLSYTVVTAPAHGQLALSSAPGTAISSFTQAQIDGGLVVYVHSGDEALADSFQFTISDAVGSTLPQATFSITVQAQNDAPTQTTLGSLTTTEGGTTTLGADLLTLSDVDNTPAQLTYTIVNATAHGQLELSSAPGTAVSSFTQAQINDGLLRYVHDGSETTTDSFSFTVSDGSGGTLTEATVSITITPVNDAPTPVANAGLTLDEGGTTIISTALLGTSDADHNSAQLTYTITSAPSHGQLERFTAPGVALLSFTQQDIDEGLVRYVHDGSETSADSFVFTVSDSQGQALSPSTFAVTVIAQNDNPIVVSHTLSIVQGGTSRPVLDITDADTSTDLLTLSVSGVVGGTFVNQQTGLAVTSFLLTELDQGLIVFIQDGSPTVPQYLLSINDGEGSSASSPNVTFYASAPAGTITDLPSAETAPEEQEEADSEPTDTEPAKTTADTRGDALASLLAERPRASSDAVFSTLDLDANNPLRDFGIDITSTRQSIEVRSAANRSSGDAAVDLDGFTYRWTGGLQAGANIDALSRNLEALREQLLEPNQGRQQLVASTVALSTGLSVGYVIWLVRGGALLGSMLSSMPLWNMVDPLPVLNRAGGANQAGDQSDGDAELEGLFDGEQPPPTPPIPPKDKADTLEAPQ